MTGQEVIDILVAEGFTHVRSWVSEHHRLQQIIGEDHLYSRKRGSGVPIEYTEEDVRRAVAHLRIRETVASASSHQMSYVHEQIKNVAVQHNTGSVIHDGHSATWKWGSELRDHIQDLLIAGKGFIVIPCRVESLENNATVALQTEES